MRELIDRLQDVSGRVQEQAQRLVRAEIDLAKAEMADKAKRYGMAGVLGAGAGVLAFFAVFGLLIAAIWGLGEAMPIWLAALIVALIFLLGAGILVLLAVRSAKKAGTLVPEAAIANIQPLADELINAGEAGAREQH